MTRAIKLVIMILLSLVLIGGALAQVSGAQSFYESIPDYDSVTSSDSIVGFFDSLTTTDIDSLESLLKLFIAPIAVNFTMFWYVFNKVLKMAEASLTPGKDAVSIELSTTGQRTALTMSVFASFIVVSITGIYSPAIASVSLAAVMISAYFSSESEDERDRSKKTIASGGL